jgi:hypothetical protein
LGGVFVAALDLDFNLALLSKGGLLLKKSTDWMFFP